MTAAFDDLARAVAGVIAQERIGRPVFVRWTLHGTGDAAEVVRTLAAMTGTVGGWVGQSPARLLATGSVEGGQVCLTLQFPDGASALVSCAYGPAPCDGGDLLIVGSRGTVTCDAMPHVPERRPDSVERKMIALVERALAAGRPLSPGVRP